MERATSSPAATTFKAFEERRVYITPVPRASLCDNGDGRGDSDGDVPPDPTHLTTRATS